MSENREEHEEYYIDAKGRWVLQLSTMRSVDIVAEKHVSTALMIMNLFPNPSRQEHYILEKLRIKKHLQKRSP